LGAASRQGGEAGEEEGKGREGEGARRGKWREGKGGHPVYC